MQDTPENREKIQMIKPYVYYGRPSAHFVSTMLHKKAYLKTPESGMRKRDPTEPRNRKPLNNNMMLEEMFGELYGIYAVEDIVHLLTSKTKTGKSVEAWEAVAQILEPFTFPDIKSASWDVPEQVDQQGFQGNLPEALSKVVG